ncbi:hypothetical protein AUJ14_04350 [Candidatus Micrarchaeota archaeon CG1_02_55_22]|nr:MAG: hypothetical protein AUJ14_04350 [Candidatus Micrarchaeota archaeon CG1_02_55_22]
MDYWFALASVAVKLLTVVLAPILLFYAAVAWHSDHARDSRSRKGALWVLLLAVAALSLSQIMQFYADYSGEWWASFASSALVLALMVFVFMCVRVWVRQEMKPHFVGSRPAAKSVKTRRLKRR